MQVENHKEEVPFEHYEALFRAADAREMAVRTGTEFDGEKFYVNLLGVTYAITHPEYSIRKSLPLEGKGDRACAVDEVAQDRNNTSSVTSGDSFSSRRSLDIALPVQTFLLRWLLEGKQAAWQGNWKTFREMPWGELYIKPYTGRVLTRAAFTFGTRVEKFREACEKMDAVALKHGDAGYQFQLLPGFWMQIMVWEGDDEFPPNAQVLYTDNFETGFAPEDRVVAGDILITAIKGNM